MKAFQHLCMAVALTFALTLTAFAEGHMSTGAGAAPPPSSTSAPATTEGDMDCGITVPDESDGAFTETVLSVVEGVLALL